jgi:hypothetical protein
VQDDDPVGRDLAALAADPASAPEVPPAVSDRVRAALRAAGPAHTDRPLRGRRVALWCGLAAALTGLCAGVAALTGTSTPTRSTGPTADQITVARRSPPMPLSDADILGLLHRPSDLGALADPQRWSECLAGLKRDPAVPVLGATPVALAGRPATLVVLPGERPAVLTVLVLDAGCSAADHRPVAEKALPRP